jgi:hypothetical protein
MNDSMQSFYRVREKVVTEVTRTMGDTRFTISVLDTQHAEDGRYMPRHFVVTYFDAKTGALKRSESFSDVYSAIGGTWLPTSRRVMTMSEGSVTARQFTLKNIRLIANETASAN